MRLPPMQPVALAVPESAATPEVATPASFEVFYREHYESLARALVVALGGLDRGSDAADEAMTRAYKSWASISDYNNPQGWCFRVGLNYGRSVLRKIRRPLPVSDGWVEAALPNPELWRALQGLDHQLRDVTVCRLLLDLSVRETAKHLDLSEGTVKSRLSRAKTDLRKAMNS